jgi:hypothetical protein
VRARLLADEFVVSWPRSIHRERVAKVCRD